MRDQCNEITKIQLGLPMSFGGATHRKIGGILLTGV